MMPHQYLAATLKPRTLWRADGRVEVWIDVPCRDKSATLRLKKALDLPCSVRGPILRYRTGTLGELLRKLGAPLGVVESARKLDQAMRRVVPAPPDLKAERKTALYELVLVLSQWMVGGK